VPAVLRASSAARAATRAISVKARASRKGAEALRLEIERLAARLGVPVTAVTLRRVSRS
jgi:hypothetical protein